MICNVKISLKSLLQKQQLCKYSKNVIDVVVHEHTLTEKYFQIPIGFIKKGSDIQIPCIT